MDYNEWSPQADKFIKAKFSPENLAGKMVISADGVVTAPAEPVAQVLDTTGAGDLFAAGFLYGYTRERSLAECAKLGAVAAAEVISHVGPRPLVELRTLLS